MKTELSDATKEISTLKEKLASHQTKEIALKKEVARSSYFVAAFC